MAMDIIMPQMGEVVETRVRSCPNASRCAGVNPASLATGPVNPGRLYVQGLTIYNSDASITVYVTTDASGVSAVAFPIVAGASLRLDANRGDDVFLFSASGTPTVRILGV